jgi:hypothetical protein
VHRNAIARTRGSCSRSRIFNGAVATVIVDDDDREFAWILLPSERIDTHRNYFSFIACRNNRDHMRPRRGLGMGRNVVVKIAQPPEPAARRDEIDPDAKDENAERVCERQPANQARSSARIGSFRRRFPVVAKIALQIAGAITGTVGSPMPVGASVLCTIWTSIGGASFMRIMR